MSCDIQSRFNRFTLAFPMFSSDKISLSFWFFSLSFSFINVSIKSLNRLSGMKSVSLRKISLISGNCFSCSVFFSWILFLMRSAEKFSVVPTWAVMNSLRVLRTCWRESFSVCSWKTLNASLIELKLWSFCAILSQRLIFLSN